MITPESSNEFPWISIWRLVKTLANYCVDILKARWLRPAFVESYRSLRLTLSKWLFMFEMHLISDITDRWQGCEPRPPTNLNVKTGRLPSLYFGTILLVSVDCCFLCFSKCFPVISGFCVAVQYQICYCFPTFFWVMPSGFPSAKFLPGSNL